MPAYRLKRALSPAELDALAPHPPLIAGLLFHRGIRDAAAAQRFLEPDYAAHTHDPYLLKDAEKAAERIVRAIRGRERIAIYSDYDADGIPGAVIWQDFFSRIGFTDFSIYIPHRHDEGFGLNDEAVAQLAGEGVRLLVTLDCGITDAGPISLAAEKGMDVIVTDHHEPPQALPSAYAIVDHKQDGCRYPDKGLCGSGVAYKLIQAVIKKNAEGAAAGAPAFPWKDGHEKWLLDMVGIATLSDMVPLTGENRVFARYGLEVLRKSPRKGLVRLLEKLNIPQRHLTEDDIAFMVTPRINAASRMGQPMDAFRLLSARTDEDARELADRLDAVNSERKGVVAALSKEVKRILHDRYGDDRSALPSAIVLGNPEWRPSLLGLVANACAEQLSRPVFLWGRDGDGGIKGSCRSEGASHVVEIMRAVPEGVLLKFGGHKHSGGFEASRDHIHFLDGHIVAAAEKESGARGAEGGDEGEEADAELSMDDIDDGLHRRIAALAPFGTGNPKPVFVFRKATPVSVRAFGKAQEHIEVGFARSDGKKIPAISFFGAGKEWAGKVAVGAPVDLVASIEKSMFRGRPELRLRIEDVIYS
ncbi:MAG: single-stranded-DNA-specific exonuclease RecJ [Patescibacteria group bacterium]|nr:single-stranded-DNA-specific exonuclease RecJ [Patescibacteria group bacterium]